MPDEKASFLVFFLVWAAYQNWDVPEFHYEVCDFLESFGQLGLLMMPRGHGKSTILGIYNAWRYYCDPTYRILHQGDQDKTAYKCSRDTKAVLERHPLTRDWATMIRGETAFWWTPAGNDERNPSMQAAGILSNITSSRADEIQNDDVEVPRNIGSAEMREKLRYRLSEQIHILIPGGRKLFVGTPHTYETVYDDIRDKGADCLILRMFQHEHRIESADTRRHALTFRPEYLFRGIGKTASLLVEGQDYALSRDAAGWIVTLAKADSALIDCYAGALWPERFTPEEMESRRRECWTLNEWDSQYQLHAKPPGNVRLDPEKAVAYDCNPAMLQDRAGEWVLMLGKVRLASVAAYWDCALAQTKSDESVLAIVYGDTAGNYYWHVSQALEGDIEEQCRQVIGLCAKHHVNLVHVETNGIGNYMLRKLREQIARFRSTLKAAEAVAKGNKQDRIIGALGAPLSARSLWMHVDVLDGAAGQQMQTFNPVATRGHDDHLDAASGAILNMPVKMTSLQNSKIYIHAPAHDWRQSGATDAPSFQSEL